MNIDIVKTNWHLLKICLLTVSMALSSGSLSAHTLNCGDDPNTISGIISYVDTSFCEFCGDGQIRILVTNPTHVDMADFSVTHDFQNSDLEIISTVGAAVEPIPVGDTVTWNSANIPALALIDGASGSHTYNSVEIVFNVRSKSGSEDDLLTADRNVIATTNFQFCPNSTNVSGNVDTGQYDLPLHEPLPTITKLGRNHDAAQDSASYSDTVYGNNGDDVIWQIEIANAGLTGLQDLQFNDVMQDGNFVMSHVCIDESSADILAASNGAAAAGCSDAGISNSITDYIVANPYGHQGIADDGSEVDVNASSSMFIYLVGKITDSCFINTTNTASNVEWGCNSSLTTGGITQTSANASAGSSTTTLSSFANKTNLTVTPVLTGLDTTQDVGSRGLMTITISNQTGGTIKNIKLRDVLPTQYVVDSTFIPTINVTPAYGNYTGMVDSISWTNPAANTVPLISPADPDDPLANIEPEFSLLSSEPVVFPATTQNLLRHGDFAVIRFRVVMIEPTFFDLVANIDEPEEMAGVDDPANSINLSNQLFVTFEDFCNAGVQNADTYPISNAAIPSNPEDLDVVFTVPPPPNDDLIFILTNTDPLPITVEVNNNGGNDADNYFVYVSFGATMEVTDLNTPNSCTRLPTNTLPSREVWDDPVDIPLSATVFECDSTDFGVIPAGGQLLLNFSVVKTTDAARLLEDDLSLRADVIGEIHLSDGTPLWFDTPSAAPIANSANNYSFDSVRARVIGFNLTKTQIEKCSEQSVQSALVEIGEECKFHIDTGGWFGFETPGFTYIAVQNIQVVDELPSGQVYISSTDPALTSSAAVTGISLNLPGAILSEGEFDWTFNTVVPGERITVKDQWFRADATTRITNKQLDASPSPNIHADPSTNVLTSTFDAVFNNAVTGLDEIFTLGLNTIGYPSLAVREFELTVTEPDITVIKEICNESLYGVGPTCSNFVTTAADGDTEDEYIYRIRLTNGTGRATAYNIIVTDELDESDQVYIIPFNLTLGGTADQLNNDGDISQDEAGLGAEGTISDNIVANGIRPVITFSHTHSSGLTSLAAGATVDLFYRVDPVDTVSPLEQLDNTVSITYDSLAGDSGNQTVVPGLNDEPAGARVYNGGPDNAILQILPLDPQDIEIINLSNTTLPSIAASGNQPVVVGEEIEYRLRTLIPVANLRNFFIRNVLPAGLTCIEYPDIDLDSGDFAVANFDPGGTFTPTCVGQTIEWNFGNQKLRSDDNNILFDFPVTFIARVDNSLTENDTNIISNGATANSAFVSYVNEAAVKIDSAFNKIDVEVTEPEIVLTKTFETATNDAADVITVTVTATNTGTAAAYNLQILDDLFLVNNLTYLGNVTGDVPDEINSYLANANSPVFVWNQAANPKFELAVNESLTFTFDILVEDGIQPNESLNNTVQSRWTSLPEQGTSLNASGLIGADGTTTGMRIGAVPNVDDAVNDYESTAETFSTVPALTISKNDLNPALLPEIGAHKNFEIVINLPEGVTNSVLVNDELDRTGLSYVLSNNASFDITYSFSGIATINAQSPSETAFSTFPADATSGNAIWNIGTVVTSTEDDTVAGSVITPTIRINYFARINNDATTNNGSDLQNFVTATYTHGEDASTVTLTDDTPLITATESVLTVTKVATLISTAPLTGGDIVEYTITVSNTGNATAYDVNVVDTLPPELQLDTIFIPTAVIGGTNVTGFDSLPLNNIAGPLIWGRGNADNSLDIPATTDLVLTYQVLVNSKAEANTSLVNSVLVDWTSLNGSSSYERTGASCPAAIPPNDYCATPATSLITVADTNNLNKTVINDSFAPTNDSALRIGDTVTYQLSLNLQEGSTRSVNVQDVLPAGLEFVDVVSINGDISASYTPPVSDAGSNFSYDTINVLSLPVNGQTGIINFPVGDVINDPLGDDTTDTLNIVYSARVVENTLAHLPTTALTNTATLSYLDGASVAVIAPARLESNATINVLQPVMTIPTKIDRSGRPDFSNVIVATDVMNFRLSSCNSTGLSPAYNLQITDTLAAQFNEASISGPVNGVAQPDVYINGGLAVAGIDYTYTAPAMRGGNMLFELIAAVNAGQCVEIDYDIGFYTDFGANQNWNNTVDVDEYWSLDLKTGQLYAALGPTTFTLLNNEPYIPPQKILLLPANGEATIGEEVTYRITVPISNAARFDVVVTDQLDPSLEYISATEVSGNGFVITDNSIAPGNVSIATTFIPAGQEMVLDIVARVLNNAQANAGHSFNNTIIYTNANSPGGTTILAGSTTTILPLKIVEPEMTISKTVTNITHPGDLPTAGDVLRYSLTLNAVGAGIGDNYSNVFDVSILDQLSPSLRYQTNSSNVSGADNTITDPTIFGDGITAAQSLNWNLTDATANIDIVESNSVTVNYDVLVLDTVLVNQILTNSAVAQWTGLQDSSVYERNGTGSPAVNDYITTAATTTIMAADNTAISKTRLSDTFNSADDNVRIGDIVQYELRLALQQGQTNNVVLIDNLPQGMAFEKINQINGITTLPYSAVPPFVHEDIVVVTAGNPLNGSSSITFTIGDVTNVADVNNTNDEIVIIYTARVLENVHPQQNTITLVNNAQLNYTTASGATNKITNANINLLQPQLDLVKTAVTEGGDTVLEANELVTYTVDIINNGLAPAYDPVIADIIPLGMRNGTATITQISTTLVNANISLTNIPPVYDVNTGQATWNFDTGVANAYQIPVDETLRLVYRVQTDANIGAGLILNNQVSAQLYYSFDNDATPFANGVLGVREIYGPSSTAINTLTTPAPGALLKENPANLTVSIGETFSYQITIPEVPVATTLHDVRILDDLTASLADLTYVSVTKINGSLDWIPVNTGTATNVIIEDLTTGIDIPAGEQIVISVTVRLENTTDNVSGLAFNNTANYSYNQIPDDVTTQSPGTGFTTADMTIVGPDNLTLEKTGPAEMRLGMPEIFTLNVKNIGTAPAWDLTITDLLPNLDPQAGGMCNTAPDNVTAQIFMDDGVTAVSPVLVQDTDYVVNFTAAPDCILSITMQSPQAVLAESNRLIVTYQTQLDLDTPPGSTLINIAGVTQWFSLDTAGAGATDAIRTYSRVLTNGTVGTLDHQDALSVDIDTPVIRVQKRVFNVSSGQDPGSNAQPGDVLRYSIFIQNLGPLEIDDFNFIDDLDALNASPMFLAGSLKLVSIPLGSNVVNTNASGGTKGSGLVDVRRLVLGIAGTSNDTVNIEFEVTLLPVITNATVVLNQGFIQNIELNLPTDDPNINGVDDPLIRGDENATETLISSAAQLQVFKTSEDMTDDPAILVSGDTLRYTITVKNIGDEDAVNVMLRDQLPANTTYVAGTTTLNGNIVNEPVADTLPLLAGISINAVENNSAGYMRGDATDTLDNVATIVFDVIINADLVNGTVISNQAFVTAEGAGSPAIPEKASDDPATIVVDDPTRDVIGNQPLLDALKTVMIEVDNSTPGILDPGDILRYTITVMNIGATAATNVTFADLVPADTTYIADSVTLNGLPLGQPDAGVSPLMTAIAISSSDLVSSELIPLQPIPTLGNGIISAGESAVISFNVQVNADAIVGTVISNQGTVESEELPTELTDSDGIDMNGDQPTLIVVGNAQLLRISKDVAVVGGGAALAGGQLEYRIRVVNIGLVPAMTILITDDLDLPIGGQMTYVDGSGLLNELPTGVSFSAPVLRADYGTNYGSLEPGESAELRFTVLLANNLSLGTNVTNIAEVFWDSATKNDSATASIDIGGTPGVGNINGALWHDANFNNTLDNNEQVLTGWHIDVFRDGQLLGTQTSDDNGLYQINGLLPNDVGTERYELHYRAPGAGNTSASLGQADSPAVYGFSNELHRISNITLSSGSNAQNLNLPIDPNGMVYDSILRTPVAGATVSLLNAVTDAELSADCFDDVQQQNQITLANGYYKFDLNFSQSDCAPGARYLLRITAPTNDYVNQASMVITPQTDANTAAFNVPACLGSVTDVIPATNNFCEAQPSEFAPAVSVPAGSVATNYYLHLTLDNNQIPGESQLFNNHLPVDPVLTGAVSITKVSSLVNVTRSQLVPYTITITNTLPVVLLGSNIIDNYPAGFKYVEGSARFNGAAVEPARNGLQLFWNNIDLPANETQTIKMLLIVGAAVNDGEYVNRVEVFDTQTNGAASGQATATVRVIPDPAFDCSDVIGKVFEDKNLNAYQDEGENGLAGIRVVSARGLAATSDQYGRFHVTCAVSPDETRGNNFIMKVDERTLPTGYRMTTENPRVLRATRGKMMKFSFGATIHRVVSMDLANDVFVKESNEIHDLWKPRLNLLMEHLQKEPSVLHLSYFADTETSSVVDNRLEKLKTVITEKWQQLNQYRLIIETEIFWRRGAPPERGDIE